MAAAKAALNKNERYTPAMLVMAKSYYKLHKYEWMKKLWEMMQANGASDAGEGRDLPAARLPRDRRTRTFRAPSPSSSRPPKRSPTTPILWNNLGAQYLAAKNYARGAAGPREVGRSCSLASPRRT